MDKVKVTFESEDGKKAIVHVDINRSINLMSVRCDFEPEVPNSTNGEPYLGLAMIFIKKITQ